MKKSPVVSVVIPSFNQAEYLGRAIASVLAQSYEDFEVVVVDDGSTDDTSAVARSYDDPRVRYFFQQNRGLSAARNAGLRRAAGSLFSFLDSDDQFLPDKLTLLVAALETDAALGFVAGQAVLIDEQDRLLGEVFDRRLPPDSSDLLLGNPLHVGSVLLRREWQERVGFFDESLRSYEDWDYWLRLARAGCPMGWVDAPVSLYRFHEAQMTRIGDQMTTASFAVLQKTFQRPDLPARWRQREDEAYSRAFLRAAAQSYTAGDFAGARESVREAVRLNPALCAEGGEPLARLAAGWANHVKTREPMAFLESVYDHLPEGLEILHRRRRRDLAREALFLAFAADRRGDVDEVRLRVHQAVRNRPQVLLDRAVLAMLARTCRGNLRATGAGA